MAKLRARNGGERLVIWELVVDGRVGTRFFERRRARAAAAIRRELGVAREVRVRRREFVEVVR